MFQNISFNSHTYPVYFVALIPYQLRHTLTITWRICTLRLNHVKHTNVALSQLQNVMFYLFYWPHIS